MGWETRKDCPGSRFYTRTKRVGKRRIRIYFGAGPLGEMAWINDVLPRIEREIARRQLLGDPKPAEVSRQNEDNANGTLSG